MMEIGMDRSDIRKHMEQDRMTCLMVGCDLFLMLGDHPALLLCTDADL